jgi:hypothetical protein
VLAAFDDVAGVMLWDHRVSFGYSFDDDGAGERALPLVRRVRSGFPVPIPGSMCAVDKKRIEADLPEPVDLRRTRSGGELC